MSKKCGECKWFNKIVGIHCTWHEIEMYPNEEACGDFEPLTVFDHITESVETLAKEFVAEFSIYGGRSYWCSLLLAEIGHSVFEQRFNTKEEAIAATIEELKKEWKENDSGRN